MIRNYFKIALRHLQKSKLYAFVNIIGLAIGICSCLLIGIYIWNELSYDGFHKNADRIARVTWQYNFGDAESKTATTGTKVGPEFTRRFPEVQAFVRTMKFARVITYQDKMFDEKGFLYADSSFFSIFSFPLIKGNAHNVLNSPDKIVLTQSSARKYFGKNDPVGKTLKVGTKDFEVTGIAADAPDNSQIKFDFVGTFTSLNAAKTEKWDEANYITYLLLKNKKNFKTLQSKVDNYTKQVMKEEMHAQRNQYSNYHLEPFKSVHLHSDLDGFEPNNNINYVYILGAVAFLILLIACVNYTNLSTAQSAGRSAEIGMRKVMGAGKQQVFYQFISESFLLTLVAVIIALIAAVLLLPYFNEISGKALQPKLLYQPSTLALLMVLTIIVALAAGAYPAFILSNSKVINVLKSGFNFTGSGSFRKSLIVLQFVISIFLIVATIVILQQLSYIKNKDLGYIRDQVVVLPLDWQITAKYDDLKKAVAGTTGVLSVGGAYEEPTDIGWGDGVSTKDGSKQITVNALPVDEDLVRTLGFKIVAGSDYTQSDVQQFDTSDNDSKLRYKFMLNESAAKALGWKPEEAIGKTIVKNAEGEIKAVVKDFHFRSMHEQIKPLLIFMDKRLVSTMFVKIAGTNINGTLKNLETVWKQRIQHRPFEYHFLDEDYAALYKTEQRTANVFTSFSTLAILLACLGLFALTAYTMVRRTKEIGIRKILGATVPDILSLVSKDFLKLILIAVVIASPVAWYATNKWLEDFSYKIQIEWWVFALAGCATLLIAFITISLQAIKTAMTNPVKNLRTE
ncbi:MAG: ABC transporter permease [Flavisolibacter sp.]